MQRFQRSLSSVQLTRTTDPQSRTPARDAPSNPGAQPIHIDGPSAVDALIQSLQRADAEVPALHLHLSVHIEAAALVPLLATLDLLAAQGRLAGLTVTVDHDIQRPIPAPLRWALAGSKACLVLSGASVRPLIVGDPAWVRSSPDPTLADFLNMALCKALDRALEIQVASVLSALAMKTPGEDALLRAVAVLSPGHQWRLAALPDAGAYTRLANARVPLCLNLSLTSATAGPLAEWLATPRPLLHSIELRVCGHLDGPAWMLLWTRVVGQPSLRQVEVDIQPLAVVDGWAAPEGLPLRPMARVETVRLGVHHADDAPLAAWLVEWLHPQNLTLGTLRVDTTVALLQALANPQRHDTLRELRIVCGGGMTGPRDVGLVKTLIDFLQTFDRVRAVYMSLPHPLPGGATLQALRAVVRKNLLLGSTHLVSSGPSPWAGVRDVFAKPLWRSLGRGDYFLAHCVGGLRAFFFCHLHNDPDLAEGFLKQEWLPMSDLLSLSGVSIDTRRAAVGHRSEAHAPEIVRVMRLGLLDPSTLRELLTGPTETIDPDLVRAVSQQLRDGRQDPGLWRLLDEATALG